MLDLEHMRLHTTSEIAVVVANCWFWWTLPGWSSCDHFGIISYIRYSSKKLKNSYRFHKDI